MSLTPSAGWRSDFGPLGHPRGLEIREVVEEDARDGERPEVLVGGDLDAAELRGWG